MSILKHVGTKRHSGRYPWGSGKDPQRNKSFVGYVKDLKKQGLSEIEIAKGLGISVKKLRERESVAKSELRESNVLQAIRLKEKGYSNVAIGERMGVNESTVRSWLDPNLKEKNEILKNTADILEKNVLEKGPIDVGSGVETHLSISRTKLDTAVSLLEDKGYNIYYVDVPQLGTGKDTTIKVLAPPGMTYSDLYQNRYSVKGITDYSEDGGRTWRGIEPPTNINSDRIFIRYKEDGGGNKDGVIEVRRGVEDISLGNNKYAQVRVAVNGTHFMKGMAMYTDSIPDGYDMVYNVTKPKGTPKEEVFKPMKDDPDNPFSSTVRQYHYLDSNGKEKLSAMNMVNEEGSWKNWTKSLSSQVLSKQLPSLAKKQLGLVYDLKEDELNEILELTNPSVKKRLLETFADDADSAAVHLKAAALPRQMSQVLLPVESIKENQIFAPNFRDGENVVLIRHPHGGTFEIPELIVNNKNPEAIKNIGKNAVDAVGIHPSVASRLSGADFDGDTVLVIPNKSGSIKTSPALEGLKDFDPRTSYKIPKDSGIKPMTEKQKQTKMGDISNLITDMTIKGAKPDEIARAVKHSMVVIDAPKHSLNYKQSYLDNKIGDLKKIYQGSEKAGASTLISKAKSDLRVLEREPGKIVIDPKTGKTKRIYVDPETGKKLYEPTGETYTITKKRVKDPVTGKVSLVEIKAKTLNRLTKTTKLAEAEDAFDLSSGTAIETVYALHSNKLKALANKARKLAVSTKERLYSPSARETYDKEVAALKSKLNAAYKNKPLERQAQLLANKVLAAKKASNPDLEPEDVKKIKAQALEEARSRVGAGKKPVVITDREWEAIQAGAITKSFLKQILLNTDLDALKVRATPRYPKLMSPAKISRARALLNSGHTPSEVADALGVSIDTIEKALQ